MNIEHLVKMANQIGQFFRAEPDRDAAVAGIETHLRRYWEPRMRKAIVAHLEQGGEGLEDLVKAAVRKLATTSHA
jgi:formate dehydrogenase subunit delta